MRKAALYLALTGCFLFALLLETVFTQAPTPDSEAAAAVTIGDGRWIEVPETPPADWPPASPAPGGPRPSGTTPSTGLGSQPEPPGPDPVAAPAPTRVVVKPGDNLWDLAAAHLGSGRHFRDLAAWNGLDPAASLREGAVLRLLPPDDGSQGADPAALPGTLETHIVRRGENLSVIAERYLGSARLWTRIRDHNHLSSDRVTEGMLLRIPATR